MCRLGWTIGFSGWRGGGKVALRTEGRGCFACLFSPWGPSALLEDGSRATLRRPSTAEGTVAWAARLPGPQLPDPIRRRQALFASKRSTAHGTPYLFWEEGRHRRRQGCPWEGEATVCDRAKKRMLPKTGTGANHRCRNQDGAALPRPFVDGAVRCLSISKG